MDGSNLKTFLHMWKATYSLYKNRKLILEQLRNAGKEILIKDAILMVDADCAIYEEGNVVSHQLSLTVMEKKYGGMYL